MILFRQYYHISLLTCQPAESLTTPDDACVIKQDFTAQLKLPEALL